MIWAAGWCLVACLGICVAGPRFGRLIHPATATRLLAALCLAVATAVLWVLGLVAGTLVAQIPVVARAGDWSPDLLAAEDPVPRWVAYGCVIATLAAAVAGVWTVAVQASALIRLHRALAGVPAAGRLTVLSDERRIAFATPAAGGRIVVSSGMLRALEPDERRVLLAHESAHTRHGHYWWTATAHLAATVCPILRGTARAGSNAAERWADEDAAAAVGDREVVARALARAAVRTSAGLVPRGGVASVGGEVLDRVEAMMRPRPVWRVGPVWLLVGLLLVGLVAAWAVGVHADTLFDQAAVVGS